jgi:toxin ParE1/3/4
MIDTAVDAGSMDQARGCRSYPHLRLHGRTFWRAAQARRAALAIFDNADSLKAFPQKGRPGRRLNTRELNIPKLPFVLIYRVRDGAIEISRILHAAQKWP